MGTFNLLFPQKGTLRFAGETMFAAGQWAGVELDDECGRNDGSHGGIRYFSCKPKRGKKFKLPFHQFRYS